MALLIPDGGLSPSSLCMLMKRTLLALVIAAGLLTSAKAQDPDPWLGLDKAGHFALSVGFSTTGYAFGARYLEHPWERALVGAGIALTVGASRSQ